MPSSYSFGFPELLLASRLVEADSQERWCLELSLAADADASPFLIAAGVGQALEMLEDLSLATTDVALLHAEPGPERVDPSLDAETLDAVAAQQFAGDVEAVPEGTVLFPGEPLLRLTAPAPQAAVVGAALSGVMRLQTAVATAVARFRRAAAGKPVWESLGGFVTRDEGLLSARAAQIGGAAGTLQPVAAGAYSLPALPTVPLTALLAMGGRLRGLNGCAVEIDGAARAGGGVAVAVFQQAPRALVVTPRAGAPGVRELQQLRQQLDAAGYRATQLLAAGCDEARVAELVNSTARVDGFVLGAALMKARLELQDALVLELVARVGGDGAGMVARRDGGRGSRAVWRKREAGRYRGDTIQADTQAPPSGCAPLLVPVMRGGKRLFRAPSLAEVRVLSDAQLSMVEPELLELHGTKRYPLNFIGDAGPARRASDRADATGRVAAPAAPARDEVDDGGEAGEGEAPVEPVDTRRLIDQVDDSADFTLVSNAFAKVVTNHLGVPDEAIVPPTTESAEEPAVADELPSAPPEPPAESASEPEPTPEPAPAAEPVAALAPEPAFARIARAAALVAPASAPPAVAPTLAPAAAVVAAPAAAASAPEPAPVREGSPLLAAAARLRSMQRGEPVSASPVAPLASRPPEPVAAAAPTPTETAAAADPLLSAALRLRRLRGG